MVTLIKDSNQYAKYLEEIESLMDNDPAPTSPEGERLPLLANAVKNFRLGAGLRAMQDISLGACNFLISLTWEATGASNHPQITDEAIFLV